MTVFDTIIQYVVTPVISVILALLVSYFKVRQIENPRTEKLTELGKVNQAFHSFIDVVWNWRIISK